MGKKWLLLHSRGIESLIITLARWIHPSARIKIRKTSLKELIKLEITIARTSSWIVNTVRSTPTSRTTAIDNYSQLQRSIKKLKICSFKDRNNSIFLVSQIVASQSGRWIKVPFNNRRCYSSQKISGDQLCSHIWMNELNLSKVKAKFPRITCMLRKLNKVNKQQQQSTLR